ncbi:P-loop nucleotide/nucleoside kinase family protein [Microlunatus parietis]|uniref:Shikimate kinase n=1 Tax=Microlunatus parietis TaxID=682979 RepID=A0A7Y9LBK2_9ACTN|nr:AAA family ATPase [Microlunatus parietis]NYE70933.1 hypothetical protein [Microlunatus parietis]
MELIYLYGPPAVGKLTVANELARRTGFRVFHNHLSIDCVRPVFDFGTEPFWRQVHAIRENILAEAARSDTNVIFTTVYAGPTSEPQTSRRFDAVRRNGGRVRPVRLVCDRSVAESRVIAESRRELGKLATVDGLRRAWEQEDLAAVIPDVESLTLDTSLLDPAAAAGKIIESFRLPTGSPTP